MIKVILFDLDETLADSREVILDWWRGYFAEAGHAFPDATRAHLLYTLPQEKIVGAFELGPPGEAAYARYLARVGAGNTVEGVRLKAGARETLDWCRARFELALATNRSNHVGRLLGSLGIAEYFSLIVSGENAPHFKPHPWGIQRVLEHFGVTESEVVYVGDSPDDIAFARNGGIACIAVGDNWKHASLSPTWAIDGMPELPSLLASISQSAGAAAATTETSTS